MNRHGLARFIRRWHARLGVTAALFFLILVVTGVALNHTERLGLARTAIQSQVLNSWYGLPRLQVLAVYPDAGFVATPNVWLYQNQRLAEGGGPVVGVLRLPDMLAIATSQSLNLYTPAGERIDALRASALPQLPLIRLGRLNKAMVVDTPQGNFTSADGLIWQPTQAPGVQWAQAQAAATLSAQQQQQLAPSLPLERIVLDLHSGRLLGRYGPLFVDVAAGVLLMLAVSGIWIQWRSWRQRRRHPHHA